MINIKKSTPAPICLEKEKQKINGDYKCGDVLALLKYDFHNKCYLCEDQPTSINVEHFEPHQGNKEKKFDWKNLFFSCAHCNNIKLDRYNTNENNRILDCTDSEHDVENGLKYEMVHFPKKEVKITALKNEAIIHNTVKLLSEVYNGTTKQKKMEAENLKDKLQAELIQFQEMLTGYLEAKTDQEKALYLIQIKKQLKKSSNFRAFKQQIWALI
ncbi:MAG: hypothetical protein VSS75_029700 [Candidatus Parabeggiatoa sp.]|nr:hypothetical protein [Candidatus Parabeggiatoa sp.]